MRRNISVWLVVVSFSAWMSYGQVTTGTISGTVVDSSAAVLPGAEVVVLNEDTGIPRTVQANTAGRYSAPSLIPGRYRVTASVAGFQTQVRSGIQLTVGREAIVNFELPVGAVTERVEVTGEAPLVQTTEAAVGYLVDDRTIRELPLNGRDISQLILLNPGVVQNANGKWGNADKGFGKRYSISGMRGEDNSFLLDGSYINDYYRHHPAGPTGALAGVETVREFQTLTSTFSAAYGRALGGVFNAVTKSGTNEWHGSAYEFLRNNSLDARNFFDQQKDPSAPRLPPFRRNQFGAAAGGPVFRDKMFFFAAYEGLRERLGESSTANVPDLNARQGILPGKTVTVSPLIVPFLNQYPLPSPDGRNFGNGTQEFFFQVSQPTTENFGQGRIDHQISDNDSIFLRFSANNAERARFNEFPDLFEIGNIKTRLWTLSETHIISPAWLNAFRFSYNRVVPGSDHIFPGAGPGTVSVPGHPNPGGLEPGSGIGVRSGTENPGSVYETKRFAFHDDVNTTLGNHAIQFGGMVERLHYNPVVPFRPYGEWRFGDIADFLQGIPDRFRGTPPSLATLQRGIRQSFLALYVQDDWKLTPSVALNLGLRWEPFTVPTEVNGLLDNLRNLTDQTTTVGDPYWNNKSWTNFSPRVGIAWSPFASGRTSVRAGFGVFFAPTDSALYTVPLLRSSRFSPAFEVNDPLHFPNALAAIAASASAPGGGAVDAYALPFDDVDSAHALQYSFTIQQQLGASNVLSVGYSGRQGVNLPSNGNFNIPLMEFDGVSLRLPNGAQTFNKKFNRIFYISNNASSSYHGLGISLQRRFSAGLQAQVSYTFSKAISVTDGSDTGNHASVGSEGSVPYPHELNVNKGLSGYHLKNVFTANYSYDLPVGRGMSGFAGHLLSGWQLTGIMTFQSGQPFGVLVQAPDRTRDHITRSKPNRVPGFTQENTVLGDPNHYFTLDAFSAPAAGQLGNAGRNGLIGPGMARWDFGLHKNFTLTEKMRLQLRIETFNLTNRVNFSAPSQRGTSGGNVQIFTRRGAPVESETVVRRTVDTSRQIQFGLKLTF